MDMILEAHAELERALAQWRRMDAAVEGGDLCYLHRGRYEDYRTAIRVLAAVLGRYVSVEGLLASWRERTMRSAVVRACILAPGRGALNAEVLEGAAYWRRFCQLVAQHAN